jgi:hypothetical protein
MAEERHIPERTSPFQIGDMVALGLRDGRCPVGGIAAMDGTWISLRLKNFFDGATTEKVVAVRWEEIERVELAYREDSIEGPMGEELQDEHLGEFQSAWQRHHFGDDGRDPVEEIRRTIRLEDRKNR